MFISRDQKERDSATAYSTTSPCANKLISLVFCYSCADRQFLCLLSGMMVEVLGTVLGTAIQGQIVGGNSNCPTESDAPYSTNSSSVNTTIASLDQTVSLLKGVFFVLCQIKDDYCWSKLRVVYFYFFLSSETSLLGCFRGHMHHLRPVCCNLVFRCERAKRYESFLI